MFVLAPEKQPNTQNLMYFQFANVLVFFALAVVLVGGMLLLASFLRPDNPEALKLTSYECGEPPTGGAWVNFNIRFYIVALVFLIFEVEIVFLVPVAVVFKQWVLAGQGWFALAEIGIFLAILLVGLVYVWVKGDFEWIKKVSETEEAAAEREQALREAA
jgi:NADH-quinone oxidoreductase subunit A